MRPTALLPTFAAMLVAFAAGWWARDPRTDAEPYPLGPREGGDTGRALEPDAGPPARHESSPPARTSRVASVELDRAAGRFAAAGAGGLGLDGPPGPDITGRVVGVDGLPLAGVLVRAEPEDADDTGACFQVVGDLPDQDRPLGDLVRELLASECRRRSGRREATTDDDGRYRLTGLVAGVEYDVDASFARHYVRADGDSDAGDVRPGDVVGFVATPLGAVRVELVRPDGMPVAAAEVVLHVDNSHDTYDWTPTHDVFQGLPGTWSLTATCAGLRGEMTGIEVGPLATVPVRVDLGPVHDVRIHVVWPAALARGRTQFRATPDESSVDGSYDDPTGEVERDTVVFRELAPGKWWIRAEYPSDRIALREMVDTTRGPAELRWELPSPDVRDHVIVRVLDPSGRPLADVDVEGSSSYWCTIASATDVRPVEAGVFRVTHARRFDLEDARFEVRAKSPEHGERTAAYVAGSDAEVTIRFPPSAPLTVRVPSSGDRYVRVRPVFADPGARVLSGFADEDGTIRFDHVACGAYEVRADAFPGTAMRVTVPSGGPIVYEGVPCRAWLVEEVRAGSGAAASGFREGDRIVGVDGVEFRDAAHRTEVWVEALTRERFEADVVRDGSMLHVPLASASVRDRKAFGASLTESLR